MAKAPRDPNAPRKARKPQGPQRVFILYKGTLEDIQIVKSADAALDLQDQDKSWQMKRFMLPRVTKKVEAA